MTQLTKPYYRIWRPLRGFESEVTCMANQVLGNIPCPTIKYLSDNRFACQSEMKSLINTTHLIIRDLYEVFNFIESDDRNLNVFSHRLYELFLRICTEFESNCKGILYANSYSANGNLKITDYYKLESVCRLSAYKVIFNRWSTNHVFIPFQAWGNVGSYAPLPWYQDYNKIKHNRFKEFDKAKFSNIMDALAGLICILHAQIGCNMSNVTFGGIGVIQNSQFEVKEDSFTIQTPCFNECEYYTFIWDNLKNDPHPVNRYPFI